MFKYLVCDPLAWKARWSVGFRSKAGGGLFALKILFQKAVNTLWVILLNAHFS